MNTKKSMKMCVVMFCVIVFFPLDSLAVKGDPTRISGWVLTYENDGLGNSVDGDIMLLVKAIREGADVKVMIPRYGNEDMIFNCESTYIVAGNIVACQNTSVISVDGSHGLNFGFQDNAYNWYVMLNTEGKIDMSRWLVGEHTLHPYGHTQSTTGIKWFARVQ